MPVLRPSTLRRGIALGVVVAAAAAFTIRLVDVQLVQATQLNADAEGKRAVPVTIPSLRGDIVDRNGEILGTTTELYDIQLSPKNTRLNDGKFPRLVDAQSGKIEMVTAYQAFGEIGEATGQSADEIQKIVDDALAENPKSDFAYVKRFVDLTTLNKIKALGIPWVTATSQFNRVYPNGAVAGNLIGFSDFEGNPQEGVERAQDKCLTGTDGAESYERGADGVKLPGSEVVTQQAINGGTVTLSIDLNLQYQAQQAIEEQVRAVGAEYGYLLIMDTRTGEIVANAEDGSPDPNNIDASDSSKWNARSYLRPYEPGSTFKTITAATLIDQGVATPLTQNLTPDTWAPEEGVRFGDAAVHETMPWTLTGILSNSSNVGISMIGSQLSAETRYDYLQRFGIGISTQSGMPFEDGGMLRPPAEWDRQTYYNTMFGQGLSSTIVQTAGVYQTIANGGLRVPPTLVESCTDPDGNVTKPDHGEPVQAVSKETADTVMHMLEAVTYESWLKDQVSIPGYLIAGKTGTAEQSDGQGGLRANYVHSYAGIFPADDPQYVAVASIGHPAITSMGGVASLRAFKAAAEATIRTFHIPPSTENYQSLPIEY